MQTGAFSPGDEAFYTNDDSFAGKQVELMLKVKEDDEESG